MEMKKRTMIIFVFILTVVSISLDVNAIELDKTLSQREPDQIWVGEPMVQGHPLRIVFCTFREPDGTLTAVMDSPDTGMRDIPVTSASIENGKTRFEVASFGLVYEGKLREDGTAIEGTLNDGSMNMPVTLELSDVRPEVRMPMETISSADVDGWWTGEFQGSNIIFNFKSDGDVMTGVAYDLSGSPVIHIKDGKKDGDKISFWSETDIGENKLRADYKGDVKDYDIMFDYTTTVTDPQGSSQESPMPMPFLVNRIGTGNETYDEIKEILKKKIEADKKARPVPSVPVDAPLAKPVDPIDAILEAFKTHNVVALSEGSNHRCIQGHEFRLALIHDPRFPKVVNDIVVECGNALYQEVMDRYTGGEEVPYDELSQVWMKTTQTHGIWNTPIYYEFFRAVRDLNKNLPKDRQVRVLLGDPPVDRENQTDEEYFLLASQRDSYPAGVIEREVIAKSRHALVIYGAMHFLRKKVFFAISDKEAAEKMYGGPNVQSIVALLESKGIKVFSIWGSVNDFAQSIQPDVSSWEIPSFVYLKDNVIGLSPFTTFYPHKMFLGYMDSEGKQRRESVAADPMRSGLMQEQFDALMTYGPAASITFSK